MLQLDSSERQQGEKDNVFNLIPEDPAGDPKHFPLIGCDDNKACAKGTKCNVIRLGIQLNRPSKYGGWLG